MTSLRVNSVCTNPALIIPILSRISYTGIYQNFDDHLDIIVCNIPSILQNQHTKNICIYTPTITYIPFSLAESICNVINCAFV